MMEMSENTKFQNTAGSDILTAKSGISNHAASNILDDLCFSKFGTFHGGCPQSADNFRTFVCAPLLAPESPLIVCGLSDTPRELSKRGKTQNSMSDVARKKYSDFTPKNCRCRLHLELIVFSLSIQNICHSMLQKSGSYFSSEEPSRSFMLPYMPASFPRRASSNGMSAPAGSTSGL